MKILMVNKFFYLNGGSETYYFALKKLLELNGHTVIDFSMADNRNFSSDYSGYFVINVDYSGGGSAFEKLRIAKNIIYSNEAKKKFEQLVKDTEPDIVHLNIFQHQISPSILDVIKKYKIPTVYTEHDLKMICLNYQLLHHGRICEDCKDGKLRHCLKNKCVKDSYAKSFLNFVEGVVHRKRRSYDVIGKIINPSEFQMKKFIEFGVEPDRLIHMANFFEGVPYEIENRDDRESYYLYFGRLSHEKGVPSLVKAVGGDIPLYIVGTGPDEDGIKNYINEKKLDNIKMLGFKSGQELYNLVGNAKAVIMPSVVYENSPYSAIEALSLSRPIIGADIGGIPELVNNNGFLFKSGNSEDLRAKILELENADPETYNSMKKASFDLYKKNHMPQDYYDKLMDIYKEVCVETRG
ncbi:MAG: glycosyltransferase [Ruminococcus sp.]|nr:glycosyltransferase [Ruminococcus sp.]